MKTRVFLFIGILLLGCSMAGGRAAAQKAGLNREGSIRVFSSPDLYNLAQKWAGEYVRLNPKLDVKVTKVMDADIPGLLKEGEGIGFITNESDPAHRSESVWSMVVGRDVIVPVMNAKNPFLDEINKKGLSAEAFARIFAGSENLTWGNLLENGQNTPVHCYMVNDASVRSSVADFVKVNLALERIVTVESGAEMAAAIGKDPNAIGFCRMASIMDENNQNLAEDIKLLPIDKNGNGKIDYIEKIYDDPQAFSRGVWIGKYPKALSGNIFAVSLVQPTNEHDAAFLTWVLTTGQKFLKQQGFSDLVSNERQTQLDKLNDTPDKAVTGTYTGFDFLKLALLIIIALLVIGFIVELVSRQMRKKAPEIPDNVFLPQHVFDENSVIVPKGIYFDKTHTWAFMEKDGSVKIGIDDFLQHVTGSLSGIGMKPAGVQIKKGDALLTLIQKGKHLLVYSPVSGTILASNQTLMTNSSALNAAPYTDGWVYMIEPANWTREIQFLTMAEKYKTWLKDEFSRLKDFFAAALQTHSPEYAHVVMQDGGALQDNILADVGPKVWEDFQTKFIDTVR